MEPSAFWAKISEYGLAGIVIGALFVILWRMLIWVMKWVDKINEQHNIERTTWIETLKSLNNSIELHNQGSIEARKTTEEAHRYQKEEHEKLAEHMSNVCNGLEKVNNGLAQTEKALGRINGYTK